MANQHDDIATRAQSARSIPTWLSSTAFHVVLLVVLGLLFQPRDPKGNEGQADRAAGNR